MSTRPQATGLQSARTNKLDLLERLADDLAHEIKNPLHSMVINLEVLKRRVARYGGPAESDEMMRYIRVLDGELERVNKRIDLLLRLARPGRGAELTTLDELLGELVELIELEAVHQDVSVRFESLGRPTQVRVPSDAVRQVILNLVLEVLDALTAGDTLAIRIEQQGAESVLLVQGIPASARSPRSRWWANDGNDEAVRLSAARVLAESLGGTLRSPEPENGDAEGAATGISFSLSLPIARG
ncbi:MAG TPA: histidine kinase dimerization/phospho-acceptor domain-containing protein [Longimicrobiaceae bacterium]|nr:histidine kinase dimerization/phospho-acceptor domain-containing protein [Longimicrobiaceae bacterium]